MADEIEAGCWVLFADPTRPEAIALGGPDVPVKVVRAHPTLRNWWMLQAADGWETWVPGEELARVGVFADSDSVMLLPDVAPEV